MKHKLKGFHHIGNFKDYGDVRFDGNEYKLPLNRLKFKETLIVPHKDIFYYGYNCSSDMVGENCICCNGKRYRKCNTNFPGILVKGFNPHGLKYRMIDGKHRITKLINAGITESKFRIVDKQEFLNNLSPINRNAYTTWWF
tara:strand:+ start:61 stop:483 length:423 start_codon:yes stop_codon:yes gene_type:complete